MILVTGATGIVGRPLLDLLLAEGAPVRAVSRDPGDRTLSAGIELEPGNPALPATMTRALRGVTSIFLNPRAVASAGVELLARAADAGVKRVVTLSAANVEDDPSRQPSRYRGDLNLETEQAAVASGLEWVSLRPTVFAANTIGLWSAQIRAGDVVHGPYATASSAPIDERDIAAVAARALLGDVAPGSRLELTGPTSHTQHELLALIGEVLGRPLRYVEIPARMARDAMTGQGFPVAFADAYLLMLAESAGRPAAVTTTVADVAGCPPLRFRQWVDEHAAAFTGTTAGQVSPR